LKSKFKGDWTYSDGFRKYGTNVYVTTRKFAYYVKVGINTRYNLISTIDIYGLTENKGRISDKRTASFFPGRTTEIASVRLIMRG
jgi:hypothetical protein